MNRILAFLQRHSWSFVGLLALASLAIAFVSIVVLKNLYRGQR